MMPRIGLLRRAQRNGDMTATIMLNAFSVYRDARERLWARYWRRQYATWNCR